MCAKFEKKPFYDSGFKNRQERTACLHHYPTIVGNGTEILHSFKNVDIELSPNFAC